MATFLTNDVALYVSKTRESAYNTDETTGTNYLKVRTQQPGYVLPQVEFINDAGVPGNGHEFATEWCATYIAHPAITFTDDINFGVAGRLALRALGGAVTTAQLASTTAYKHSCSMLTIASGRQLPSTTIAALLGGASFRMAGMVVDRYRISQNRADRPQYSCDMVGSGDFTTPHGLTSLPSTVDTAACLNGNSTSVYWTDADGTTTFSGATCTLRSWFVEVANSLRLNDRCPGDSTKTLTYDSTTTNPAFAGKLLRGSRAVTAQIVILLDSTIVPWERFVTGQELTDVTFKAQSGTEAGTGHKFTVNYIIPKARITSVEPTDNDGDAALTINLVGMYDSTSGGALNCEVINAETSAYV
jgi:hypothetical protein